MSTAANTPTPSAPQAKRALLAERLRQATSAHRQRPLSFAQQRLWFLDQLEPNSPLYNIATVARFIGNLDAGALEQAFNAIIARHEALRTRFVCPEETPMQEIAQAMSLHLRRVDLRSLPETERAGQLKQLIREEVNRSFNLSQDQLVRATLLQLKPAECVLILIIHHIVADEWSLKVLFHELAACYEGYRHATAVALPELPIQYADYAVWQRDWLQGPVLERHLTFWRAHLDGNPPITELPTDHPRRPAPSFCGANQARALSRELSQALQQLANAQQSTLFMVLLAAFKALLYRYTQQEDIVVGSPIAGRNRVETEGLIGFFVNTLPLRTRLKGDLTFEQLLARVREGTLGAYAHQDLPFEKLVEELQPERSLDHMPFAKLMFVVQNSLLEEMQWDGVKVQFLEVESDTAKFDATLVWQETSRGLVVRVEYNSDLFAPATIGRLLQHLENVLKAVVANPKQRLAELPLLSEAERQQLLMEWNQTATEYPHDRCIHHIFEAQVEQAPQAIAVSFGPQSMSYGELNARANQLAHYLKQFHIGPDVPVGICVERSLEMVVGVLAILKAGGAYVPLDATYPRERLEFMLQDTATPVLLTQQSLLSRMPHHLAKVICLDADWELVARESRHNLPTATQPDSLAYVMYTSGSTGQPKGVAVPHRAVNRLVLNTDYIQLDATDRIAQVSNFSFDAATFEIWGALLNGGQLIGITKDVALSPKDFARELREQGITAIFLTSALFNQLASEVPGAFESLRTAMAGGEALDPKWVRSVLSHRPPQRLVNGYGPTENTTFTCCYHIRALRDEATNVPIGRPIANTQVYILDRHLNPVPIGVPGELYAGGDGVARGYWKRPELTAEKFIPNPFGTSHSASFLYKTGDLARYLPDGNIEFLGRIDQQVKVRGFRIELGEIETVLGRHPGVRECVVTVYGKGVRDRRLAAYFVPGTNPAPNASELRAFVSEKLPDYMVPAVFVPLTALPLTPNGKVDRKALPAPDQARPDLERKYACPRDTVERELTRIWENVLGVHPIGIEDKFFDLGGHSLLAVRVIGQIEKTFGKKLRLATIFQAPTIEQLAAILREEIKESSVTAVTSLVEIQSQGSRPPLFLVHGAGGGMFWGYVNLSRCLGPGQPVYGFKSRGLDGQEEYGSIKEMAAQYVADLRLMQPQGPYYLGGYCFGGNVAFEMARQLAEQNQPVALLALLNCAPPNSRYTRIPWTPLWGWRLLRNLLYWGNYFRHWSPTQRREFFRWKGALLKKKLGAWGRPTHGDLSRLDAGDLVDLSSYTEEQRKVWAAHVRSLLEYRPEPFPGRVHLFRSPGHPLWCSFDPDYGWGDLAREGVEITIVPGAHEKILEEPCVQILARHLDRVLQEKQGTHGPAAIALEASQPAPEPDRTERQWLGQWNQTRAEYPVNTSYVQPFEAQVERTPTGIAVSYNGKELTYAQLNAQANQLAWRLQTLGVKPGVLVGVCLPQSTELMVALLAVLKAGGAYLPLDRNYPIERLAYMLTDSQAKLLLTQKGFANQLSTSVPAVVCVDDPLEQAELHRCSAANLGAEARPDSVAYVIYTSGSTGTPKGVPITHRSLLNHNFAIIEAFGLQTTDRVLQFSPLSFDVSVEEIFPSWLCGSTVVLRTSQALASPADFLEFVRMQRISVLNLPTAYWHELLNSLDAASLPDSVRLVVIGGETASDEAYKQWKQRVGTKVVLMNAYGTTETTVTTTLHRAQPQENSLPIGRPIANNQVAILNEQLQPVPAGEVGELYIGGAGVASGYLNRPELTAERFIANPFPQDLNSPRLYKTGDLGRFRPDGTIELLGRSDQQVKLRGYRIEPAEIEALLLAHPDIKEAVAIAREDVPGQKRLVAYVVPKMLPGPAVGQLLTLLKERLPAFMVPAAIVKLPALPLSPAGKVDRRALPAPGSTRPELAQPLVPPRTPVEEALVEIWSEVLGISPIGVQDNFFDLGGHSLLATQVLSRVREVLQVELPLVQFFVLPTVAAQAQHLGEVAGQGQAVVPASVLALEGKPLPLSARQRRIWFLDQFEPHQSPYNVAIGVRLTGMLNLPALEQSLGDLARRQPALRTIFPAQGGRPSQYLCDPKDVDLPIFDLSDVPPAEQMERAQAIAAQEGRRAYIMSHPLLRPLLVRFHAAEHWLLLILHELAADRHSVRLVVEELAALYAAHLASRPSVLPPLPVNYEAAMARMEELTTQTFRQSLEYWKRQLTGAPTVLELPADRPRPVHRTDAGARLPVALAAPTVQALEALSQRAGCSLFSALLAGFAALLQRYTGSTDLLVGSLISMRPQELGRLVGNFDNLVALRCDVSNNPTFSELMGRLHQVSSAARVHAALPFSLVLEAQQVERNASHTPLFQVFFDLQEGSLPELPAQGMTFHPFTVDNHTAKLDLALHLEKSPAGLSGWIEYSTDLFDEARMQRLVQHLEVLLEGAALQPDQAVSRLPLLPEAEVRQVLQGWNNTVRPYPTQATLFDLFSAQVERTPEAEALVCGQTRLTYRELSARAGQVARRLRELGVGNETLVGICLERSWEMVAGILGTLQAGAAYVPLDPLYPAGRLAFMLQDARARVLVTQRKLLGTLPETGAHLLCVEDLEWLGRCAAPPQPAATKPTDLAYVIYTSGSTGQPKGVALEHRSAVAFVCWAKGVFTPEELSGVLASTSICFDVSVFELFVPLCWGGRIILANNPLALPTLAAANEVKVVVTVPSAMRELLRIKGIPASVQVANLAGEPLTAALADQIYAQTGIKKVYDLYGPTETTTYSTFALRQPGAPATIGRPLDNEQVYLLDSHLQPVPIGIPGELYIGGVGLAREYLNRPDLTAERFISHPFIAGTRLYKTGDLARWRPDGNLEYLGRIDHQVKIRGFRIELGEIEAALKQHPAVHEAVVVARQEDSGDKRLLAYVVQNPGHDLTAADLRQELRTRLPEYMVPSLVVFLEALPKTPSGKVDRKALPAPEPERQRTGTELVAPRTPVEEQLAAIWSEVLQLKQVGVLDNFFDLGGHSLHAIQVISRVREIFQQELPLFSLFDAPTIAALAQGLESGQWSQHHPPVLPLQAIPRRGPLPVSFVQERLWFMDQLEPGSHAYNVPAALRLKGGLDVTALQRAFNELLRRHEVLRTSFRYADGELSQVIAPSWPLELQTADLCNVPAASREKQTREWVAATAQQPFDLTHGPLIRAGLVRLAEAEHALVVVMHHTISDGWSLAVLFQELAALYTAFATGNEMPALPALPVQYADFAHWQRQVMHGPLLEQELTYWKERLAGAPAALDLPTDRTEPEEPTHKADHRSVLLPETVTQRVGELTHREGDTPFMVLLAALAITLHKWSEQRDLVIGTVVAGRNRREIENVLGCFMNFLPLRTGIAGTESGQDLLAQVRQTVLEAQSHQDCPFEKIVEAINPKRKLNRNPLYNVALLLQNFPAELFPSPLLEAVSMPVSMQAALLDLRFEAVTTPKGLAVSCEYKTDLFDAATIEQLLASLAQVVERLVLQPTAGLSTFQVTAALSAQAQTARSRKQRQTLAVTATFTAEPLKEPLAYWMQELEVPAIIEFAPYNQVFQQLLDPASLLATNSHGLNLVLLRLEDWVHPGPTAQAAQTDLDRSAREFVLALKAASARRPTPWLICFCPPSLNLARNPATSRLLEQVEASLVAELVNMPGVYVASNGDLARWYPVADYYDASGDELGHVPYTPVFFTALGTLIARKFQTLNRPAYKVIVLDCDQTLWGGVCGEDGPHAIRLDRPWQALQEFMRAQQEAGKLLCICSKNNEADVREVFAQRHDMPLRLDHFTAWRLNWEPKSQNLKSLAHELQLGLDSFIFLDDNPVECAEVEANCPEVLTLQLPEKPELFPQFLEHCWAFDHLKLTAEDRQRAEMYRQNQQREQLRSQSLSLAEFLAGLGLKIDIAPLAAAQVPRVAQLTQRTNQFNFTTRRFSETDLQPLDSPLQVLTVSVRDRFGDYGLVGVIRYALKPGALEVDSFLLSCRVLGRGVEHRMLACLGELAQQHHLHWVDVHFIKTARNKPALDFLENVGAEFKQALNGGLLFRFPAGFAAEVAFNPQTGTAPESAQVQNKERSNLPAAPAGAARKFARYRAIALQCQTPARIHDRLLANTVVRPASQESYTAPQTELERKLCELWQQLLHVKQVGVQDNFFALGGHSLLAVRLFAGVEKLTGRKLPLVTLFQAPTVEQLARVLNQSKSSPSRSLLVPIQPQGSRPPLFLVHGAGGDVLWGYANLAAYLDPDQPIYGIKSRGQVGQEEFTRLEEMASCYLQAVRALQPKGPYYLGGYCFGGNVAYEMARQLQAQGEQVGMVALLDSAPSNAGYERLTWWRPDFGWQFARNLCYWLQDFAALKPQERRSFFLRKIRALGRKFKHRFQPQPVVDLEDVIDPTHFPEQELKLWRIHLQALVEHVEQPYPGSVLLLRTRGQPLLCSLENDFCWGKLAQGGVVLKRIPGSHENIFMEPNVKCLAQELSAALAQAQGRGAAARTASEPVSS